MGSRVTEPPLAGLSFLREPRESSQRMGRLVLWLSLAVLLPAPAILQPLDQAVLEEQEQMRELLTSMFIDNHREGRDLEEDMDEDAVGEARDMDDENEDESNLVDDEADTEEVVASKDPQEIARFNNYMDAIYRRMNAALRAKLMDPMVLNMNAKVAKKGKKDKKKRVERSADLEEDEDKDEVDRMGEVEESKEDKEAKKMARKEKKKKRKNKKNKKDKKEKKWKWKDI